MKYIHVFDCSSLFINWNSCQVASTFGFNFFVHIMIGREMGRTEGESCHYIVKYCKAWTSISGAAAFGLWFVIDFFFVVYCGSLICLKKNIAAHFWSQGESNFVCNIGSLKLASPYCFLPFSLLFRHENINFSINCSANASCSIILID